MTQVRISVGRFLPDGASAAQGRVRCAPDRRFLDDERIMLPTPFEVCLDEQGEALVSLEPTRERFAWRITVLPRHGEPFERLVEVPDSMAVENYIGLLDVDPSTLLPPTLTEDPYMRVHWADSEDAAYEYSREHPDMLVLYEEEGA